MRSFVRLFWVFNQTAKQGVQLAASKTNKADRHKMRDPSIQRRTDRPTNRPTDRQTDQQTNQPTDSGL